MHKLTAMLCGLCSRAPASAIATDPQLAEWWQKHQGHDALVASLQAKKELHGINSLTPTELDTLIFADDVSYEYGEAHVRIINP